MAKKIIAFFVEGPTEIEFYKTVVKYAHDRMKAPFNCSFEWIDMQGIGNYKNTAARKMARLKESHPNDDIYAMLCIDTDVFEFSKKPPIDKSDIKKRLKENGAKQVNYIEARSSIEDWFLDDLPGVCSFLNLPANTSRPSGNGQTALKQLFRNANKIYVKGGRTENFIAKLDIPKIISKHCEQLKPFCSAAGLNCMMVCNCPDQ